MNETVKARKIPVIEPARCNRCNKCVKACPQKAILEHLNTSCEKCIKYCMTMDVPCSPENIVFEYDLCDGCGVCIDACPQNAIYWFATESAPGEKGV